MAEQNLSSWSVADLLRGDYKQSEYGKVILPFTVLRRLDCVADVLVHCASHSDTKDQALDEAKRRAENNRPTQVRIVDERDRVTAPVVDFPAL